MQCCGGSGLLAYYRHFCLFMGLVEGEIGRIVVCLRGWELRREGRVEVAATKCSKEWSQIGVNKATGRVVMGLLNTTVQKERADK